jgi:D-3-phosphoglycerate dehydrogenase / 2-oxoglutarate reductase
VSQTHHILYISTDGRLYQEPGWFYEAFDRDGVSVTKGDRFAQEADNAALAPHAEVVLNGSGRYPVTADSFDRLANCRLVVRMGAGYDTVDVAEATRRGILVANMPANIPEEVSDHAISLFLASLRYLGRQTAAMRAGQWDPSLAYPARRLRGQTLGLVGFGRIARLVVQKVAGLGLNCLACDPYINPAFMTSHGVEPVSFDDLLRRSDVISIHAPATPETRGMFNAEALAKMKPSAILINTARGALVDETALVSALKEGRLRAAGLDVFGYEPIRPGNPLLDLDNVILTPHVASYSEEGLVDYFQAAYQIVSDFLVRSRIPETVINPEVLKNRP